MSERVACVIFFKENEDGTFDCGGYTGSMTPVKALEISMQISDCCVKQVIQAEGENELEQRKQECLKNMKNKEWVETYLKPYL